MTEANTEKSVPPSAISSSSTVSGVLRLFSSPSSSIKGLASGDESVSSSSDTSTRPAAVTRQQSANESKSERRSDELASRCVVVDPASAEKDTAVMELVKSFAVGSISASFSSVLLQPLDLVKTRLQLGYDANEAKALARRQGLVRYMQYIAKTESVRALWRGTSATIARSVPGVGLYFSTLHTLKVLSDISKPTATEALVLGVVSRCLAGAALLPATVIKTRFESGLYPYRSVTHAARSIYASEGLRGLYSGLLPTLARDAPYSGLYLLFYTQLKSATYSHLVVTNNELHDVVNFTCGIVAGLSSSLVTHPADVLKTRMQSNPTKCPNVHRAIVDIYKVDGIQGYFSGLAPRLLRRTLMSALAWTFYERLSQSLLNTR